MAIPNTASDGPAPPQESAPTSLVELLSDWYWEQDAEFRFTVVSTRRPENSADPFPYVGRKHWEQPALNLSDADWERHRAQLEWHQPFRDFEVQHVTDEGRVVWVSLSGVPVLGEAGVGYALAKGFEVPPLMFTGEEVEALVRRITATPPAIVARVKQALSVSTSKN